MLESQLEHKCASWALTQGVQSLKVFKQMGWPDRIFLKSGRILFVEFKRKDELPRKLQLHRHKELRAWGFTVEVIDSFVLFKKLIEEFFNESN